MAIKPILFNTEMVRAILDGRKTVTRRLVKFLSRKNPNWTGYVKNGLMLYNGRNEPCIKKAPYHTGDILYVRETWCGLPVNEAGHFRGHPIYYYRADGDLRPEGWRGAWHPSIHMPKEAARIWLKAMNVRVERLQDITPKDAENEGVGNLFYEDIGYSEKNYGTEVDKEYGIAREQFVWLWESTIKKSELDRYGWKANPWVWVIEFERCDKPEGR
jgi:hypothetical protein